MRSPWAMILALLWLAFVCYMVMTLDTTVQCSSSYPC